MEKRFVVKVSVPKGVSVPEMSSYIREAVKEWGGKWSPEDPLSNLNKGAITVRPFKVGQNSKQPSFLKKYLSF